MCLCWLQSPTTSQRENRHQHCSVYAPFSLLLLLLQTLQHDLFSPLLLQDPISHIGLLSFSLSLSFFPFPWFVLTLCTLEKDNHTRLVFNLKRILTARESAPERWEGGEPTAAEVSPVGILYWLIKMRFFR